MVYLLDSKTIDVWFSQVKKYRTGQNDKMNYLFPEMKWPIRCAAGTGGGLPKTRLYIKGGRKTSKSPENLENLKTRSEIKLSNISESNKRCRVYQIENDKSKKGNELWKIRTRDDARVGRQRVGELREVLGRELVDDAGDLPDAGPRVGDALVVE